MTTFISYSRANSEFAVRFAKDLKVEGFDVWLDQLDIPKGSRWDDEIEKALDSSSTFIIVLSPESINSQNVKDEVGYAIDNRKHILPVLLKPCKVPFRLRRFQFVDLTDKSYQEGLNEIKGLLINTKQLPTASDVENEQLHTKISSSTVATEQERPAPKPRLIGEREPESKRPQSKLNSQVIVALLGIAIIVLWFGIPLIRKSLSSPIPTQTLTLTNTPEATIISSAASWPAEITDANGVQMVLVPAGEFTMGSDSGNPNEQPVHQRYLDAFYMDKYEVTNSLYQSCVNAGGCDPPHEVGSPTRSSYYDNHEFANYPVIYMDWFQSKRYCEWRGGYLPTEAQWEKAARGTEGRTYPWGEGIGCDRANYFSLCVEETTEVGSYESGKSQYGVYDMAGNVWEWVSSSDASYPYSLSDGREDLDLSKLRVIRGGAWDGNDQQARSTFRFGYSPDVVIYSHGFRCAMDANP